jgi:hypothetical protein
VIPAGANLDGEDKIFRSLAVNLILKPTLQEFGDVECRLTPHFIAPFRLHLCQGTDENKSGGWILVTKRGWGLGGLRGVQEQRQQEYQPGPNGTGELGKL